MANHVLNLLYATLSAEPCIHSGRVPGRCRVKVSDIMNTRFVWIEILLLATAVALATALLLATLGAAAGVAIGQARQLRPIGTAQSFEGMVTCSRCGAKHQPALDRSASTCVRVCVHGGASFALIDDESVYLLDGDLGPLKTLAGQRARVTGTRTGNTIKVMTIASSS
jgi:hypothetical protein